MELKSNPSVRKGGVVWLFVAILVAFIWQSPMALWPAFLVSWVIVGIAWISVKAMKRTLSGEDATAAIAALAIVAMFAVASGVIFAKLNSMLLDSFVWDSLVLANASATETQPTSLLICIALSLLMAGIAAAWLLSAVLPSAARNSGVNPFRLLLRSAKQLKGSGAAGPAIILAGSVVVAATMIAYDSGMPARIAMGLVIAYTQLRFMAQVERPKTDFSANGKRNPVRAGAKNKRVVLIALFSLHLVFSLFYIALYGIWHGWGWAASIYPLIWLSGALYALIAWLFAQVKVLYILLLIIISLACALLLGMIVGIYGMEILA